MPRQTAAVSAHVSCTETVCLGVEFIFAPPPPSPQSNRASKKKKKKKNPLETRSMTFQIRSKNHHYDQLSPNSLIIIRDSADVGQSVILIITIDNSISPDHSLIRSKHRPSVWQDGFGVRRDVSTTPGYAGTSAQPRGTQGRQRNPAVRRDISATPRYTVTSAQTRVTPGRQRNFGVLRDVSVTSEYAGTSAQPRGTPGR